MADKQDEKTVNIPVLILRQIGKLKNETQKLAQTLGREPTDEESGEALGWPAKRVKSVNNLAGEIELSVGAKALERAINEIQIPLCYRPEVL